MRTTWAWVLAAGVAAAPAASAAGVEGRWALTFKGGADVQVSGDVHTGGRGTVLTLPTTVEARSYKDVYGTPFRFEGELGYGVSSNVEVFGRVGYAKKAADELSVGNVAGLDLRAQFADYKEWSFGAGLRYYFNAESSVRPYLAASGGLRSVSAIPSTFSVPAAGVVLRDTPFYDKSTVATFGGDLGVRIDLSDAVALGLETGLHYQGDLKDIEGLAGTGLEPINDVGSRWSLPVLATLSFRF